MHDRVFYNGQILTTEGVEHLLTGGAMYGRGVFTTIAVFGGRPFLWEKHWSRLTANASTVGIDLARHGEKSTRAGLAGLIEADRVNDCRARITVFDESRLPVWGGDDGGRAALLITTGAFRQVPQRLRLKLSPYAVNSGSPLAGVKSCNYLENLLAHEDAKRNGFDEAVRLNERGKVASGCMANIFWTANGEVFTPSRRTGCLAGTTREFVLEKVGVKEVAAEAAVLDQAETIFLTSAGIGIAEVGEFNGRKLQPVSVAVKGLIKDYPGRKA
jgi:branched-subunit amino acid aminotransferase/4-amino-4-deoxychorismate lyase